LNPAKHGVAERYVGLMSGTSLDGIDAVLAEVDPEGRTRLIASHYQPYAENLRQRLLQLHTPQSDEIHQSALTGNELAELYADAVKTLLLHASAQKQHITAIGCHGQTVRHRPESGYTLQLGNASLLAELSGITVVSDFRSRDIAAGGQGAPLVPAFHAGQLRHPTLHRVIVNIGGIANITDLPASGTVRGWDSGPGNLLMDAWIDQCLGQSYDERGAWAAQGKPIPQLLAALLSHPYLKAAPPKSAGREQFNLESLRAAMRQLDIPETAAADVQATLLEATAKSLCDSILRECDRVDEVFVCGGGVHNTRLIRRISNLLAPVPVTSTGDAGIDPDWMEALAFAWLARQTIHRQPSNLPSVTGAQGPRILGAVYAA
jgi:anhydro-N-acetylmuramic acid kinase